MKQGYSGSTVERSGDLVAKVSSDRGFTRSPARRRDLTILSRRLAVLPRIDRMDGKTIYMEYVEGTEGLTEHNAWRAGQALRLLHERRDYPHPCYTGVRWLIELANENLSRMGYGQQIAAGIEAEYPHDALIHSEPTQIIEKPDGAFVFIDFEGIGMGSRYQDLGFIYYSALLDDEPDRFTAFLAGYQRAPGEIAFGRVVQLAGIIALAYVGFADAERRISLGLRLLDEAGLTPTSSA